MRLCDCNLFWRHVSVYENLWVDVVDWIRIIQYHDDRGSELRRYPTTPAEMDTLVRQHFFRFAAAVLRNYVGTSSTYPLTQPDSYKGVRDIGSSRRTQLLG